jgi:hypothetical protein
MGSGVLMSLLSVVRILGGSTATILRSSVCGAIARRALPPKRSATGAWKAERCSTVSEATASASSMPTRIIIVAESRSATRPWCPVQQMQSPVSRTSYRTECSPLLLCTPRVICCAELPRLASFHAHDGILQMLPSSRAAQGRQRRAMHSRPGPRAPRNYQANHQAQSNEASNKFLRISRRGSSRRTTLSAYGPVSQQLQCKVAVRAIAARAAYSTFDAVLRSLSSGTPLA